MTTHQHREPLSVDLASIVDVINARDDARAMAALWKETARRAIQSNAFLDSAAAMEQQMAMSESLVAAEAIKRAEKAEQERDEWMRRALDCATADPRPLTADGITDEMVERAWDFLTGVGETWSHHEVLALLRAALTEPPSRPEGAEGVETALLDADEAGFFNIAPRAIQDLADWLAAERGVRVTGDAS